MMKVIRVAFCLLVLAILCLSSGIGVCIGQKSSIQQECRNGSLRSYADSLRQLITEFQPQKVIQSSDSLLRISGKVICPDIIRVSAWQAYAYEHLFKFETSVEIYNEILDIAVANQFIEEEIIIRIALARVYEAINRPILCEQYLDDVERLFESHKNKSIQSHYFVRVASYHRIYKDKDVAREYARKAIQAGEESGRLGSLAGGNLILGALTDDIDESIEYAKKASYYCYEEGDFVGYLFLEASVTRKYLRKREYRRALTALDTINEQSELLQNNKKIYYEIKSYLSSLKAEAYEALDLKDSLIIALKEINNYSSLFGETANQEKINQLLLDNSVKIEKAKVVAAKNVNRALSLGLVCLLAALMLLLRFYTLNRKKGKQIQEQTTTIKSQYDKLQKLYNYQATLLSEVHHRIKNNLQLIISLLTLQKAKEETNVADGVLDMLSHRITSISLIHEQLYNLKEFDKVDVSLYARDLIKNFMTLSFERKVAMTYDTDDLMLNLETIIPLGLIWSELISNSLKYNPHVEELNIHFELFKDGDYYTMNYKDNGTGYPQGQFEGNSKGMGYIIINSLARQLFGESRSYNSDGAHFTITFKQKTISPL